MSHSDRATTWVCGACGKTSATRDGIEGEHDRGWDESCMLNAVLVYADTIRRGESGRVTHADAVEPQPD